MSKEMPEKVPCVKFRSMWTTAIVIVKTGQIIRFYSETIEELKEKRRKWLLENEDKYINSP